MSDASSSAHGTSVPQATATPATTQSQAQYSNHNQATDQSTQTAATSAVHAAAAAAAVAAVGNQNGTNVTNGTEEFVCMWQGCSERSSSAETLYVSTFLFLFNRDVLSITAFLPLSWHFMRLQRASCWGSHPDSHHQEAEGGSLHGG
jgi:hypothetical protein